MRNELKVFSVLLLFALLIATASGCSYFSPPSDAEVIKAITDTGLFSGGAEKYTLKSPIVILGKGIMRSSDGSWTVKVKMTLSFTMNDGREIKPEEKISVFKLYPSRDSSGKTVWTAK